MACRMDIRVQKADFEIGQEIAVLGDGGAGAVVTFTGLCRDEGGRLEALELEHYPGMAEAEIRRIAEVAAHKWQLLALTVVHRFGRLKPGDNIVLVVAASSHRQAAFDGANFVMDFLKSSAPFWKKEHLAGGTQGEWVDAREADEAAMERWREAEQD